MAKIILSFAENNLSLIFAFVFILALLVVLVIKLYPSKRSGDTYSSKRSADQDDYRHDYAEIKGKEGEHQISHLLSPFGRLLNDYVVVDENNVTHQIDHILVNMKGVFVIETKNYSGYVYGKEEHKTWTQVLKYGKEKHKVYNPVKQNQTHIYHLRKKLPNGTKFFSCVVFVQDNIDHITASNVFTRRGLINFIKNQTDIYDEAKVEELYNLLELNRNETVTKEEHIQNIETTLANIENGICPRCGGRLVIRKGKFGDFYGCSNYPQCTFKKKK